MRRDETSMLAPSGATCASMLAPRRIGQPVTSKRHPAQSARLTLWAARSRAAYLAKLRSRTKASTDKWAPSSERPSEKWALPRGAAATRIASTPKGASPKGVPTMGV